MMWRVDVDVIRSEGAVSIARGGIRSQKRGGSSRRYPYGATGS
jgi:hypothetical protein